MKALEVARADKLIGKSLEARITVFTEDEDAYATLSAFDREELRTIFIVSDCVLCNGTACSGAFREENSLLAVLVEQAEGVKCDRCWMVSKETSADGEGHLCPRCRSVLGK